MSKQSSIEWLVDFFEKGVTSVEEWTKAKNQAKQMHQEEIEDAFCKGAFVMAHNDEIFPREEAEQYYQETYGGNHIVETNEMIDHIGDANKMVEISDEEIDNAVVKMYENVGDEKLFPNFTDKDIWQNGFYEGAQWYREQLKKK